MTYERTTDLLNSVKSGAFMRLQYTSEVPIKSAYKKEGYEVRKITETTVRTGVSYKNLKAVKDSPQVTTSRVNNYVWKLHNRIKYNTNTNKYYISVAPIKHGNNTSSRYFVSKNGTIIYQTADKNKLLAKFPDLFTLSATKINSDVNIMTISLDNILKINHRK